MTNNMKNKRLEFYEFESNRRKDFKFNNKYSKFKEYRCKISIDLPNDFEEYYKEWIKSTSNGNSIILIDKEDDKFIISTCSANAGFHGYLTRGVFKYINENNKKKFGSQNRNREDRSNNRHRDTNRYRDRDNTNNITASSSNDNYPNISSNDNYPNISSNDNYPNISSSSNMNSSSNINSSSTFSYANAISTVNSINTNTSTNKIKNTNTNKRTQRISKNETEEQRLNTQYKNPIKPPQVFEKRINDNDCDTIYKWLDEGVNYEVIISFLKGLKRKNPKAQFLTLRARDSIPFSFNFELLDKLDLEQLKLKIDGFLDQFYKYNPNEDIYESRDIELLYSMPKDGNINNLIKNTKVLRDKIKFNFNDAVWKDYLFSIGISGINILYDLGYFNTIVEEIEYHLYDEFKNADESVTNKDVSKQRQYYIKKI